MQQPKRGLLALLWLYRHLVSPLLPAHCRFYPSCSCYAEQALRQHPLPSALALILRRLSRCHPWHPGGIDPVPQKNTKHRCVPVRSAKENTASCTVFAAQHGAISFSGKQTVEDKRK